MEHAIQTFGGVPTQRLWVDIVTMERFLTTKWPSTVIELGTGTGSFSVYLAAYCRLNGFCFHTFDTHSLSAHPFTDRNERCVDAVLCMGGHYYCEDVFSKESVEKVWGLVRSSLGPAFVYCDDGDKPREARSYSEVLRVGDFLGVHDFGSEIVAEDLDLGGFSMWNEAVFSECGSSNRILERFA